VLGYPHAARADADQALSDAREISQAATLMYALVLTSLTHIHCGNYLAAKAQLDEGVTLGNEKGGLFWEPLAMALQGCVSVLTDNASDAVQMITSAITATRSTGSTFYISSCLAYLTKVVRGRSDCLKRRHSLSEIDGDGWRSHAFYGVQHFGASFIFEPMGYALGNLDS
jgi:hypothetical protein